MTEFEKLKALAAGVQSERNDVVKEIIAFSEKIVDIATKHEDPKEIVAGALCITAGNLYSILVAHLISPKNEPELRQSILIHLSDELLRVANKMKEL